MLSLRFLTLSASSDVVTLRTLFGDYSLADDSVSDGILSMEVLSLDPVALVLNTDDVDTIRTAGTWRCEDGDVLAAPLAWLFDSDGGELTFGAIRERALSGNVGARILI